MEAKKRGVGERESGSFDLEHLDMELNKLKDVIDKCSIKRYRACHPLQNPLILGVLFEHLNLKDMKSCRSVCRLWNEELKHRFQKRASIRLNIDMNSPQFARTPEECLRNLMKNTAIEFPCNNLNVIGKDFFNCDLRKILELYGDGLESLTLHFAHFSQREIKLDRKQLMRFFQLCPNLQSLHLEHLHDSVIEKGFPKLIAALMKNSLPNLTKFSFHSSIFSCNLDAQFIMDIMDFAPNLIELRFSVEESNDDGVLVGVDEIMCALELRSRLMEQIQILKFGYDWDFYSGNSFLKRHIQTLLNLHLINLRHLEIQGYDFLGQTLTRLLEKLSPTLEILKIKVMASYLSPTQRDELYPPPFPDLMDKLKHLEISDFYDIWDWLGSIRFLERLPNLETCLLQSSCNWVKDTKINQKLIWRKLFPGGAEMNGFRHDRLRDLSLPSLWSIDYVRSVKDYFPALRRLSLCIYGDEMLAGVIETLKDSLIQEFFLTVRHMTSAFDAALTGIPAADCQKMTKERTYWPVDPANRLKVSSSFADWKCLRKLSINCCMTNYPCWTLSGVAIYYGFALAGNITSLELVKFKMTDGFVMEFLNKMPLTTLKLICCKVIKTIFVGNGAMSIQDRIKIIFPNVDFLLKDKMY